MSDEKQSQPWAAATWFLCMALVASVVFSILPSLKGIEASAVRCVPADTVVSR